MKDVKEKYRYKDSDILRIVHLVDTDGTFIDEGLVKQTKESVPIRYYTDHIETTDIKNICERNQRKSEVLCKLSSTGKIGTIPYRLYYMSCNLEHVLYDELRNFTPAEKWSCSDEFAEKYEKSSGEFITFISDSDFAVEGSYRETWNFIQKDINSLNRYTNFHQLFLNNSCL